METLALKVVQSVEESWPVLDAEAVGRLMVKLLVEIYILKMLPAEPVATTSRENTLLYNPVNSVVEAESGMA